MVCESYIIAFTCAGLALDFCGMMFRVSPSETPASNKLSCEDRTLPLKRTACIRPNKKERYELLKDLAVCLPISTRDHI